MARGFRLSDIGSGKNIGRFLHRAKQGRSNFNDDVRSRGADYADYDANIADRSLQNKSRFQGDSGTEDVETSPTMPMPTGEGMKLDGVAAKSVMEGGPPGFAGGNMAGLFGGLSKRDTQLGGLKEILGGIGSDMSKWSPDQIGGLQKGLSDIGAYDGEIDGILGPKTTKGLRQYQGEQAEVMKRQNDPGAEFSAFPQGLLPEGFEDPGFKDTGESGREFANFPLGLLDGSTGGHLNLENNQPMENPGRPNVPMEGFQPDTLDDAVVGPDPQLQEFTPWDKPEPMADRFKDQFANMIADKVAASGQPTQSLTRTDDGITHMLLGNPTDQGMRYYGGSAEILNPSLARQFALKEAQDKMVYSPADSIPQAQINSNWWE